MSWLVCVMIFMLYLQILLIFMQNMNLLIKKTPPAEVKNHVFPMIYKAIESNSPEIQVNNRPSVCIPAQLQACMEIGHEFFSVVICQLTLCSLSGLINQGSHRLEKYLNIEGFLGN